MKIYEFGNAEFAKRHHIEDVLPALCNCDHLAMQAIHAALIREGTCVTSDCCDYCIVGDKNPIPLKHRRNSSLNHHKYRRQHTAEQI